MDLANLMLVVPALVPLILVATSILSNVSRTVVLDLVIFVLVAADLVLMACVRGSIASGGFGAAAFLSPTFTSGEVVTLSSPDTQDFALYLCCRNIAKVCLSSRLPIA